VIRPRFAPLDGLLLLMTLIWGGNFSVVKVVLRELPPLGFNTLRLVVASALFLATLAAAGSDERLRGREWVHLAWLGFVGHFLYQICFMLGLARTSVANSTVILGCTPVLVTLVSAAISPDERIGAAQWAGATLSALGIYIAVGRQAELGGASLIGDLLMLGSVACWTAYTVGARPLLQRHSPLVVTAWSMTLGTALFVPLGLPDLLGLDWARVSPLTWGLVVGSAALALCVAYLIWYTAVQRLGNARTAVYSNMVPVVALVTARLWLGEPITLAKLVGVGAIVSGVVLTRFGRPPRLAIPAEE
jgi:drug/metabolite transporter (DMT)-like permease